jgi:Zn-dependent alcohol dehydrogenase
MAPRTHFLNFGDARQSGFWYRVTTDLHVNGMAAGHRQGVLAVSYFAELVTADGVEPLDVACEPQVVGNTQLAPQWPVDTVAAATVTVVGAGSIGGATVQALAEYGVGRLLLVDPDHLLWHNLVRHVEAQFEQGRLGARARIG